MLDGDPGNPDFVLFSLIQSELRRAVDGLEVGLAAQKQSDLANRLYNGVGRYLDPDLPASVLAARLVALREFSDMLDVIVKPIAEHLDAMKSQILPDAYARDGITTQTLDSGHRVTLSTKYFASMLPDQKAEAMAWLRENGLADLIYETVNAQTLSAAGKAMIENEGRELPEAYFRAHLKPNISVTKTTKKS